MFKRAKEAIDRITVVGIMETYNISVELIFRKLAAPVQVAGNLPNYRQSKPNYRLRADVVFSNSILMKRAAVLNMYDIQLYRYGTPQKYFLLMK